jgi:transcriptional regulator with XRE-family HTH domain
MLNIDTHTYQSWYNGRANEETRPMDHKQAVRLGTRLRRAREKRRLSTHTVARACGFPQVTVLRIERGEFLNPDPAKLQAMADAVGLDPADVLTRAGYPIPTELLEPTTYLRTKYRDLPTPALDALQRDVAQVLARYGITSSSGPQPGEDEAPEPVPKPTRTKGGTP